MGGKLINQRNVRLSFLVSARTIDKLGSAMWVFWEAGEIL